MAAIAYTRSKDAGVAMVLSVIPGLGQVYNGELGKGIFFFLLAIVLAASTIVLVGLALFPLFWLYNIYDAYSGAKKFNQALMRV